MPSTSASPQFLSLTATDFQRALGAPTIRHGAVPSAQILRHGPSRGPRRRLPLFNEISLLTGSCAGSRHQFTGLERSMRCSAYYPTASGNFITGHCKLAERNRSHVMDINLGAVRYDHSPLRVTAYDRFAERRSMGPCSKPKRQGEMKACRFAW